MGSVSNSAPVENQGLCQQLWLWRNENDIIFPAPRTNETAIFHKWKPIELIIRFPLCQTARLALLRLCIFFHPFFLFFGRRERFVYGTSLASMIYYTWVHYTFFGMFLVLVLFLLLYFVLFFGLWNTVAIKKNIYLDTIFVLFHYFYFLHYLIIFETFTRYSIAHNLFFTKIKKYNAFNHNDNEEWGSTLQILS